MTQQQLTDEQAALVDAVQMRVATQRIRLNQQQQARKAAEHYGVMPRDH
jgi:hypothetical protein